MASSSTEEQGQEQQQPQPQQQQQQQPVKECVHKTKLIQFLGRSAPIVLQNDNGPCPLLAICNVLSLRNNLNLSPDTTEVSQEKLLSLIAERLIDSNSNIDNKDAGYVENQQQNIADAIDLLPRLATGIDVNIKFRRIGDFEFTPECAIFDLLDIPLYHGWIVDPQDDDTANAIGSKSYNALTGELVALETWDMESECKNIPEEDCVDFAAATTATLGVPSPCLSKTRSFDESPHSASDEPKARKGDLEEEAELIMALKMSEGELTTLVGDPLGATTDSAPPSVGSDGSTCPENVMHVDSVDKSEKHTAEYNNIHLSDLSVPEDCNASKNESINFISFDTTPGQTACSSPLETNKAENIDQPTYLKSQEHLTNDLVAKSTTNESVQIESGISFFSGRDTESLDENHTVVSRGDEKFESQAKLTTDAHGSLDKQNRSNMAEASCLSAPNVGLDSSSGRVLQTDALETLTSSGGEPIYEGEERILDSGTTVLQDKEPVYEGEMVLANQADKSPLDARSKGEITPQQGELIRNFLKNNASQLTFYGLFCLQDGLKERELCVFFRNNHFSTMFKINGELYLLATDQGYINQPDLVWEKLNEVNGDTLFMTGNFKEFKVESHANDTWDENNAVTTTADYLASIDSAAQAGFDMNSDLQLAIALQQQEFDQQPQRQNSAQPSISGNPRMVTGPQGTRSNPRTPTSSSARPEAKSKEKCTLM
ncbi:ubiquitin carboxyl-terminal hydrolase MINDY-1 [Prunus avium]|uniref:Ubiquitin carboxyl-terminal hydrolase MINDY-1 n=1 Tax=Prunus avium TaxID=42229 RepID=A0A6P5RKM0_PRUAV|nr:ubiquitin carboxyl-terminal hydrolase MINDY-1 [Prunus avium]